jgi:hypothetical protein
MRVSLREERSIDVVVVDGPPAGAAGAARLRETVERRLDAVDPVLVLDVRELSGLDGELIRGIADCRARARARAGRLWLVARGSIRERLLEADPSRSSEVTEDPDLALASLAAVEMTAGIP